MLSESCTRRYHNAGCIALGATTRANTWNLGNQGQGKPQKKKLRRNFQEKKFIGTGHDRQRNLLRVKSGLVIEDQPELKFRMDALDRLLRTDVTLCHTCDVSSSPPAHLRPLRHPLLFSCAGHRHLVRFLFRSTIFPILFCIQVYIIPPSSHHLDPY